MQFLTRYGCALALIPLFAASAAFASGDRISRPVDLSRRSLLPGQIHPAVRGRESGARLSSSTRIEYATLLLKPAEGLETFLAEQQNPGSPDYRRWLTPEQFADRFGLTGNDIGTIVSWLQSQGLTVRDIARGRHWITFSGNAGQIERTFHTELHQYSIDGTAHFANSTDLSVPEAIAPAVLAVDGLNDFELASHHRKTKLGPDYNSGSTHYLAPDDLATIYNIAPLYAAGIDGTGQKVVVIGRTDVDLTDLHNFRTRFNLPPNDPQIVLYGPDPGTSLSDLGEADLDLEIVGAIARNATVIYVNSTSVRLSAEYAVDQNLAPVMTMSYGSCEGLTSQTLRTIAQQANAQGITWMVSSGDSGAATCDSTSPTPQAQKGATVSYPASIPEITAVGGTEFDEGSGTYWNTANSVNRASALSWIPEKVWNDSAQLNKLVGGGGGASSLFTKPVWQTGPGVPADGARDLPDLAFASSGVHDGYFIYYNGGAYIFGGTSAASPMFAAILALLNQSLAAGHQNAPIGLGNINPALYRLAESTSDVFHDITDGDNIVPCGAGSPGCMNGSVGFSATPGYDLATGLGSLDVARFVAEWKSGTNSTTALSANPAAIVPGAPVQLTATVSGTGGIPTGTVTFVSNAVALGTTALVPGNDSATATITVDGTLIAGGNDVLAALYSGDKAFTGSAATVTLVLKLPLSGSFVIPSVNPNPVYKVGSNWPFTLTFNEKNGVATTLTAFTVDGADTLSIISNPAIPANGSPSYNLSGTNLTVPSTPLIHFEGRDADGSVWKRELSVPFLPSAGIPLEPGISLSQSPDTVQQNSQADPSCQWQQQLTVRETGGFEVVLSSFTAGTTTLTTNLSQIFGTNRLAAFGMLTGTVCFSNIAPPSQKTYTLRGTTEIGTTVTATGTANFAPAAVATAPMSALPALINVAVSDASKTGEAALNLSFGAGAPSWTAKVLGNADWLKLSAAAGAGSTVLNLQAAGAGLSKGVYNAIVSIQAADTLPQSIQVPVAFVVGASPDISVAGVNSASSGRQSFAPGMWMAVYGTNLAPSTKVVSVLPLSYQLAGTSATVNGVSAPLWFVSPGQMNIQIPYEAGAGTAILGVTSNGAATAFAFPITPSAPGIFDTGISGKPGQTVVAYISGEGDLTPSLAPGALPAAGTKLANFPQPRLPLTVTVGGEPASVTFAGLVSVVGATQVNFTIPADIAPGVQPLIVTVGGVPSEPLNITVATP